MPSSGVQTCALDRKSTRLNSSHTLISYAVFCLKKKISSSVPDQLVADGRLGLSRAEQPAGDWSSSVPDLMLARGRLGLRIEEDPADSFKQSGEHRDQLSSPTRRLPD